MKQMVLISLVMANVIGVRAFFVPSKENCYTAKSRSGASPFIQFDAELMCLAAGFKNTIFEVFGGSGRSFEILKKYRDVAGYIVWPQPGNTTFNNIVVYRKASPEAFCKAWLIFMHLVESPEKLNHYLMGMLLGYTPDDIHFFYEDSTGPLPDGATQESIYEADKKSAAEWLAVKRPLCPRQAI